MGTALLSTGVVFSLIAANPSEGPNDEGPSAAAPDSEHIEPAIAEKQTEPHRVAFMIHEGPYWTIGRTSSQVREFMVANGLPGPMYIRYVGDERHETTQSLKTEVGFYIGDNRPMEPPYQTEHIDSERVAWTRIDGSNSNISRHFAMLRTWANTHNYEGGCITEIHPVSTVLGAKSGAVELRLAIAPKKPPIEPKKSGDPPVEAPSQPDGQSFSKESVPATTAAQVQQEVDESLRGFSVMELAHKKRYDVIAAKLIPAHPRSTPEITAFLRDASLRIRAIAGTIKRNDPESGAPLAKLAEAINERVTSGLGSSSFKTFDQLAASESGEVQQTEMRAILRELDSIMVRIGLEQLDADTATEQILGVVQRSVDLVEKSRA